MRLIERDIVGIMKDLHNRKVSGTCRRTKRDRIESENGKVSLYLWGTKIAQYDGENISLFSGGYRTHTTKSRINGVLRGFGCNWRIYQRNHVWLASHPSGLQEVAFVDGLTFKV